MKLNLVALAGLALLAWAIPSLAAEGTWSKAASMSAPRSELQATTLGGKIYVIGGNVVGLTNGMPATLPTTGIAQVYDPAADSWRDLPPVPFGSTHNGIAELDGKIYIAGGFAARGHAEATDRFFVYDPATDKWQGTCAPLLAAWCACADFTGRQDPHHRRPQWPGRHAQS
jgi:N-acetylneuraminic acid mutarotase